MAKIVYGNFVTNASTVNDADIIALQQSGVTKNLSWNIVKQALEDWLDTSKVVDSTDARYLTDAKLASLNQLINIDLDQVLGGDLTLLRSNGTTLVYSTLISIIEAIYGAAGNGQVFGKTVGGVYGWITPATGTTESVWASNPTMVLPAGRYYGKYGNGDTPIWTGLTSLQAQADAIIGFLLPTFSSLSITGVSNNLELGEPITAGSKVFTWGTTNAANVQPNSLSIIDVTNANTILGSGLANDGTESLTVPLIFKSNPANTHQFNIQGTNTQGGVFNTSKTYTWQPRIFYGKSLNAILTEAQIKALISQTVQAGFTGNYTYAAGLGYAYLVYEATLGTIVSIKDQSTLFSVPFTELTQVSITNAFSVTKNYKVIRTDNQLGGAITLVVA